MRFAVVVSLIAVTGVGAWCLPRWYTNTSNSKVFLQDGRVFDKQQQEFLTSEFREKGIQDFDVDQGKISFPSQFRKTANQIVGSNAFKQLQNERDKNQSRLHSPFTPPSEKERLAKEEKLRQLEDNLERIAGIREAMIMYDQKKSMSFSRNTMQTASVTIWPIEGEVIKPLQASTVRRIVCNAFAGMKYEDVAVIDGATCITYGGSNESNLKSETNELDSDAQTKLEVARQQIEIQSQKLLNKFGETKVAVKMDQYQRTIEPNPASEPKRVPATNQTELSEAVPNGTGSIRSPTEDLPDSTPKTETVVVNRLLGIEVSIQQSAVIEFIQQQLGIAQEISGEQLSRGRVALRNEITKELVRWLRSEKGIEFGSDLVTVTVLPDSSQSAEKPSSHVDDSQQSTLLPIAAGIGAGAALLLLITGWRSRSPKQKSARSERLSNGGRAFVNRNQSTPGRELAEEANEVIHAAPTDSARAFQNLVAGDANG